MKKNLLFLLLVNCAFASTLDEIRERGVLKVATFGENLPFSRVNHAEQKGMDVEIAKAISRAIFDDENKVEFVITTNTDRAASLMSGAVDVVIANYSATKWRSKAIDFASPYVRSNLAIISKQSKPIKGLADLSTMKIGAVKNSLGAEFIKKNYPTLTLIESGDSSISFDSLKKDEIDAYILDSPLAYRWLYENNGFTSIPIGEYTYSAPAVKKGNKELLDLINEEMDKLKADGRLENWYKTYMQPFFGENLNSGDILAI